MAEMMVMILDGVAQLEFDRDRPLPAQQALYLDKMDARMDDGIELDDERVAAPDSGQRARFVAANLVAALQAGDESMAAAMCSYLAVRQADLLQLKVTRVDGGISIEFDYENPYRKQVAVDFKMH